MAVDQANQLAEEGKDYVKGQVDEAKDYVKD
jgi:hypothetical protein